MRFSIDDLENFEHCGNLKGFEYYNKSLLRYFEGKYNESEIKNKLSQRVLSATEITECFSKV